MQWTKERLDAARSNIAKGQEFASRKAGYLKIWKAKDEADLLALASIGLKCVEPSPEDVERVAAVMFELDPAYRDSAGEQRIRFEDVRISNGDYWVRRARAALAAIAEDRG